MWPFTARNQQQYQAVAGDEQELTETGTSRVQDNEAQPPRKFHGPIRPQRPLWAVWVVLALVVLFGFGAYRFGVTRSGRYRPGGSVESNQDHTTPPPSTDATERLQRCEWRTLSSDEQQEYISSVLCLRSQPSHLAPNSNKTAYDDFPWIHSHVGYFTHNSAPFLPWHRWFLKIYENTLHEKCGYTGSLVYWDWTLDSDALEKSPVFDPETGFGGDGEVGGDITVGRSGRCIVDGPFAGITADYYDVKYDPHCLSRGFRDDNGNLGHINGHDISPESIEEVLSLGDYESFVTLMESRVHDAIPFGIAGDFETFTAPYDPLFFLHHTQLDRLWWLWQQRQPDGGLTSASYGGHRERHSMEMASLDDLIHMRGLDTDVQVSEVMDVQGDLLRYTYS